MKLRLPARIPSGFLLLTLLTWAQLGFSQVDTFPQRVFKMAVEKDGVYKISHEMLKKMGINPGEVDPAKIKIFGRGGGMLSQTITTPLPVLHENAIFVYGQADGKFDRDDFVLFYAEGPDQCEFVPERGVFRYQNNLYSDKNYYFLEISLHNGKRITASENLEGQFPVITSFNDYAVHEADQKNILGSGREWYGEMLGVLSNELTLTFEVPGILPFSPITIVSDVIGQSYASASFRISLNGVNIGEQPIIPISSATYGIKGYDRRDTLLVAEDVVNASDREQQEIRYDFMKASGYSQGYLDYVLMNFERTLRLYGDQTIFISGASMENTASTFQISSSTPDAFIWDVTDPGNVVNQAFTVSGTNAVFSTSTSELKKFIVFTSDFPAPELIGDVELTGLTSLEAANFIIVTHPLFLAEAERLAEHRATFNNWTVHVVTTEEIYNEFSSGRQDVSAIRNFVKTIYDKDPAKLKALLLFGRGSYDYKERVPNNTNFVATYESRKSIQPLETYSSDDFFGFMEEGEGDWSEGSPVRNHTLDVGVGRLPVKNLQEAKNVVDKIIQYDTKKELRGYWQKEIVFVADDGSTSDSWNSLHQFQANSLADLIEELEPGMDAKKMFMGTYQKSLTAGAETVPRLADDIQRAFEKGALIINYTGHGSERIWADEGIFTAAHISKLRNDIYPFLVTATCEFGRHDDPLQPSSAEGTIVKENGGSIGLVTTSRPVNAGTNFELNRAFYEALLTKENNRYLTLGEVFARTKNNSLSGVANRNFSLLGDPSMTLALPADQVTINSVQTAVGSDTLKALSHVIVTGEIQDASGATLTDFNGFVEAALFDKKTDFETIGRNNPAFTFKQWHNILFRGRASVKDGNFKLEFIVPKNISYQIAEGRFSFYAVDTNSGREAKGVSNSFRIGGTETQIAGDLTPPHIELFLGDTTFLPGGIASPDTWLIARLSDVSGINISDYGIGNSLVATIDGASDVHVLNHYYVAGPDDFTKGTIRYPLRGVEPGKHTLTLKAWDTHNNPGEATIEFVVTEGDGIVIENFECYPNPIVDQATFFFTHNRSGDDLEAQLFIYSAAGILINAVRVDLRKSEYEANLMGMSEFIELRNPGGPENKLQPGMYVARLIVRSLTNGSKNEQVTKLIVLN